MLQGLQGRDMSRKEEVSMQGKENQMITLLGNLFSQCV